MSAEREKIRRLEKKMVQQLPLSMEVILASTLVDYEAHCEAHKDTGSLSILIIIKSF